jgi:predicted CXXCH cytochrome family protein
VSNVCGTCHALMEDLFNKSPHQPVFKAMGMAGCVVCHSNHAVLRPSPALLSGDRAVCAQCHDAASPGGQTARQMAALITKLDTALDRSDAILTRASRDGMEVSEAVLREREGREALVKARVAVHAFQLAAVEKPAKEGLTIAAETYRAGADALRERDFRRIGLAVSLLAIVVTMAGLWLALRAAEGPGVGAPEVTRR